MGLEEEAMFYLLQNATSEHQIWSACGSVRGSIYVEGILDFYKAGLYWQSLQLTFAKSNLHLIAPPTHITPFFLSSYYHCPPSPLSLQVTGHQLSKYSTAVFISRSTWVRLCVIPRPLHSSVPWVYSFLVNVFLMSPTISNHIFFPCLLLQKSPPLTVSHLPNLTWYRSKRYTHNRSA